MSQGSGEGGAEKVGIGTVGICCELESRSREPSECDPIAPGCRLHDTEHSAIQIEGRDRSLGALAGLLPKRRQPGKMRQFWQDELRHEMRAMGTAET